MTTCDVAIIGAGPYGLSASASLLTVKGLDVHTFGEPMTFWQSQMPKGMLLRSGWEASHIASPTPSFKLDDFRETSGIHFSSPVPLDRFVEYGLWYQRRAVPDLDRRKIMRIEPCGARFRLSFERGESIVANRVIVAAGISSFAWRPREFSKLPAALASHTSLHTDFDQFAGKQVLVVGGGQSALESAALLHECGAQVEIAVRAKQIRWLGGLVSRTIHRGFGPKIARLLYAPTDVGPAGISQIVARPDLVRRFPRAAQDWLRKRSIRPAGARWLVSRLKDVPMHLGRVVASAVPKNDRVKVRLDDGTERIVDHIFIGTGYRVDVSKYDFLSPKLAESIHCVNGYPHLTAGFETSVPRLHILGAPAVYSFGPLMQFVVGTHYSAKELLRFVAGKAALNRARVSETGMSELELSHPQN